MHGSVEGTDLVAVAFAPGRHRRVVACGPSSVEALLDGQAFEVPGVADDQSFDADDCNGSDSGSDCDGRDGCPDGVLNRSKHVKHTVVDVHLSPKFVWISEQLEIWPGCVAAARGA